MHQILKLSLQVSAEYRHFSLHAGAACTVANDDSPNTETVHESGYKLVAPVFTSSVQLLAVSKYISYCYTGKKRMQPAATVAVTVSNESFRSLNILRVSDCADVLSNRCNGRFFQALQLYSWGFALIQSLSKQTVLLTAISMESTSAKLKHST